MHNTSASSIQFVWAAGHLQKSTWLLQKSIGIIVAYQQLAAGHQQPLLLQRKNPSQASRPFVKVYVTFTKINCISSKLFWFWEKICVARWLRLHHFKNCKTPHQLIKGRLPSAFLSFANNSKKMMDTLSRQPFSNKSSKPKPGQC